MKSELLIVIPAYNEEENIENVVTFIKNKYSQYDYIVVNDGSKDRTAEICRNKGYEMLNLPVNLGLAGAFQAGLKYAYTKGYSYAIQLIALRYVLATVATYRAVFIRPSILKLSIPASIISGMCSIIHRSLELKM